MQGSGWRDTGYPRSVYYGDFLLYIPRCFGFVWFLWWQPIRSSWRWSTWAPVCWPLQFSKIFGDDRVALVCAAAYLTAGYRLLNLYVRAAAGNVRHDVSSPAGGSSVEIYRGKPAGIRERFSMATLLALALSGLIGTHLLTTEMAAASFLIVGLIFWKRTFSREVFPRWRWPAGETALLNLYFLVPFLDYYLHVPVYLNRVMEGVKQIQEDGRPLSAVGFLGFALSAGDASTHLIATPGPLLGGTGRRTDPLFEKTDEADPDSSGSISGASSGVHLLFSLGFSGRESRVGQFLTQVQFPWRYVGRRRCFADAGGVFTRELPAEGVTGRRLDWSGGNTDRGKMRRRSRSLRRLLRVAASSASFRACSLPVSM